MEGHRLRVGALAWSSSLLSSGGRDKNIYQRDIRAQDDFVSKLSRHKSEGSILFLFLTVSSCLTILLYMISNNILIFLFISLEVCGLKWSYDNRELASGGNDNRVRKCKLKHSSELLFFILMHKY